MYTKNFKSLLITGMVAATFLAVGCDSGDTNTNDRVDDSQTHFVSDETTTGTIDLKLKDDPIATGSTGRFIVEVRDSEGSPVPGTRVSCDSEGNLAILDPTTGSSVTDSFGNISGTVGCRAPGSFQLICRLPIGANKRDLELVHCQGDIPEGFNGFGDGTSTGGEGVGGGVTTDNDDINENSNVRIDTFGFIDGTSTDPGTSIDNTFNPDCNNDGTLDDPEFFTDTLISITIGNTGSTTFRAQSYRFTARGNENSFSYSSPSIGLGGADVDPGAETTVTALFADAASDKRFVGDTRAIPSGTYRVTITVTGTNGQGDRVSIRGTGSVSVDGFNNCN